jgi:hypothetical protein
MTETPQSDAGRRPGRVEQRMQHARDSLPGERDALPAGTLRDHLPEPQGDENREPTKPPMPPP